MVEQNDKKDPGPLYRFSGLEFLPLYFPLDQRKYITYVNHYLPGCLICDKIISKGYFLSLSIFWKYFQWMLHILLFYCCCNKLTEISGLKVIHTYYLEAKRLAWISLAKSRHQQGCVTFWRCQGRICSRDLSSSWRPRCLPWLMVSSSNSKASNVVFLRLLLTLYQYLSEHS